MSRKSKTTDHEVKLTEAKYMLVQGVAVENVMTATGLDKAAVDGTSGWLTTAAGEEFKKKVLASGIPVLGASNNSGSGQQQTVIMADQKKGAAAAAAADEVVEVVGEEEQPPAQKVPPRRVVVVQQKQDDPLAAYSGEVQFLARSLVGVGGIAEATKKAVLDKFQSEYDIYFGPQGNAGLVHAALVNAGLPWYKADNVINEFGAYMQQQKVTRQHQGGWGGGSTTGGGSGVSKLRERMEQMRMDTLDEVVYNKMLQQLEGGEQSEEVEEEHSQKSFFRNIKEVMVTKALLGDQAASQYGGIAGGGGGPQVVNGIAYETQTEYEPLLDKDGNEMVDENGVVQTKRRVITRPVSVASVAGAAGGAVKKDPQDEMMDKIMKWSMLKMLAQQMGGGGPMNGGVPGYLTESEPILLDGKVLLDQMGMPVMRTRQIPIQQQQLATTQQQQAQQFTPKDAIDFGLRIAEAMKQPQRSTESETMVNTLMARINSLTDQQFAMIRDEMTSLKNSDPAEYLFGTLAKMKELGMYGAPGADQNIDIARMNFDFKKWDRETQLELKKWIEGQRLVKEDKQYARTQLQEIGNTFREGIKEIGGPLAGAVKEGFIAAKSVAPQQAAPPRPPFQQQQQQQGGQPFVPPQPMAQQSAPEPMVTQQGNSQYVGPQTIGPQDLQPQPLQQQQQGGQPMQGGIPQDPNQMTDEQLKAMMAEASNAERVVSQARQNLHAVARSRGIQV